MRCVVTRDSSCRKEWMKIIFIHGTVISGRNLDGKWKMEMWMDWGAEWNPNWVIFIDSSLLLRNAYELA